VRTTTWVANRAAHFRRDSLSLLSFVATKATGICLFYLFRSSANFDSSSSVSRARGSIQIQRWVNQFSHRGVQFEKLRVNGWLSREMNAQRIL
jgi:hypothetical protein